MIDILAVGHAPMIGTNRKVYRALVRRGWNVELAFPRAVPQRALTAQPRMPEDPPIYILSARGGHTRFWTFDGLKELLNDRKPKIVLLENEPDSWMAWEIGEWTRANKSKLVCISCENDLPAPLSAILRGEIRPALRSVRSRLWSLAARFRVDHVFAICKDGVSTMEALGFRGRITQIPIGFDPALFVPLDEDSRLEIRRELALTKPVIAYFGRLAPQKGVHVLIEALGAMRDLEWQLLLDDFEPHSTPYLRKLRDSLVSLDIKDLTVTFRARHDEMQRFMNAADIIVAPSIWKEQYGRVVPEAMACGRAVVVSDIGALPELVGESGLKIPAGNTLALETALRRLICDPNERARLGAGAAEWAHGRLSLEIQADIVDSALRQLCSQSRRSPDH